MSEYNPSPDEPFLIYPASDRAVISLRVETVYGEVVMLHDVSLVEVRGLASVQRRSVCVTAVGTTE